MDGYSRRFLNSSIIQSLLLQEGREKMGNSITRRKEKKKNERFDEILADSVEDVVLMRRTDNTEPRPCTSRDRSPVSTTSA